MIYQICDVMVSISAWVHFRIYLLKYNSLSHQTRPADRYKQEQWFLGIFWALWKTGAKFQTLFNWATRSNFSITNYVKIPVFHFFWKSEKGTIKNGKRQPLKMVRSRYITILIKSWKSLGLVFRIEPKTR